MDLRETISKRPAVGIGIGVALVFVAAFFIYRQLAPEQAGDSRLCFSDDDGKTWFRDDQGRVPPYDHNGKQAVRCFFFESKGRTFVGYLQKFTESMRAKVAGNVVTSAQESANGTLVKRPGDSQWIRMSDPKSAQITTPSNPDDPSAETTAVDN
jgi:hypothetical protein